MIWFFLILAPAFALAKPDLRIYMAQLEVKPGRFQETLEDIASEYLKAQKSGADLFIVPEGIIPGYPSNDNLNEKEYIDRAEEATMRIKELSRGQQTAIALGHIGRNPERKGRALQNFLSVFVNGELIHRQAKILLPTYGPFDDARSFESGKLEDIKPFVIKGQKILALICEDGWFYDRDSSGRLIYKRNTVLKAAHTEPDLVISFSASPHNRGKQPLRTEIFAGVSKATNAPVMYINQTGLVDSVNFDGASFIVLPNGQVIMKLKTFETDSAVVDIPANKNEAIKIVRASSATELSENDQLLKSLTSGLKAFTRLTKRQSVAVKIDGSFESHVSAALAILAVGKENVFLISPHLQLRTAEQNESLSSLISRFQIPDSQVLELTAGDRATSDFVLAHFSSLTKEDEISKRNMSASKKWVRYFEKPALVLQTVNKTQLAVGQIALANRAGDLAPLADLFQSELIELANHINRTLNQEVISEKLMAPKASQPPVQIEPLLKDLIKAGSDRATIREKHKALGESLVEWTIQAYDAAEVARKTTLSPLLRVTNFPFGLEKRTIMTGTRGQLVPALAEVLSAAHVRSCKEMLGN